MTVKEKFIKHYSESNLKKIFIDNVSLSGATGIDNLNQYNFRSILDEQVEIVSRKAIEGNYTFTKYKLKLISKGRGKVPREISIPTVRDRIALRALCDFLTERYEGVVSFDLPQNVVNRVKNDVLSRKYDAYIKLDVSNFYPSIRHDELFKRLRKKIRNPEIIDLISKAIKSPTVTISKPSDKPSIIGVPQGLSISNILAAIYLLNLDKVLNTYPNAKCYRYVDDVLIFCYLKDSENVSQDIIKRFRKLGLKVYDPKKAPDKSSTGKIFHKFDYLGYQFSDGIVSAKVGSIEKLKSSLVSIFTSYKHSKNKSKKFLLWRLNLRITGCIFQDKSKGWLFFFSEITDESLLHRLDHYVSKLLKRFDVEINPKKFVRSYHEISHKKYETNYIPNFDKYDFEMKKKVLIDYFDLNISKLTVDEIEFEFLRRINKQVRDLIEDVKGFAY